MIVKVYPKVTGVLLFEGIFDSDIKGAFEFSSDKNHIIFKCPCCGDVRSVPINTGSKREGAWLWDGNEEKPTLHPSIRFLSDCKWHGWLKKGVWEWAP